MFSAGLGLLFGVFSAGCFEMFSAGLGFFWGFFECSVQDFQCVLCRFGVAVWAFFFFNVLCRVFWDADQCGVSSCRQLHPPRNREPRRDLCPVLSLLRGSPGAGPPLSLSATNPQPGGHEEPQTLHPALHSQILGPF